MLKGYVGCLKTYETTIANDLAYKETANVLYNSITGDATVSEEELQQYYSANMESYTVDSEKVRLKIILFDSFSEAYSVWKEASKLPNPEAVFADFKDVIDSEYNRTELATHNKELVNSVFKATSGELVPSVVTFDDRYAVIYAVSYTPTGKRSLADLREDIVNELLDEKADLYWRTWYQTYFVPFKEQSEIVLYFDEE